MYAVKCGSREALSSSAQKKLFERQKYLVQFQHFAGNFYSFYKRREMYELK
jgi:hypothetical protein